MRFAILALTFAAFASPVLAGSDTPKDAQKAPGAPAPHIAAPVNSDLLRNAPLPEDYMLGKKEAPVTVIEYASLSCPHCAHFHNAVVPTLEKEYIESGKVRYILRQYPLNEPALKAAMLVDCVGEEGGAERYYTFAKVLFNAQDRWAFDTNFMSSLATFASVGGVSKEKFTACTSDPAREKKILQQRKSAEAELKVNRTPYVFVDAVTYEGNIDAKDFSAALDAALSAKGK